METIQTKRLILRPYRSSDFDCVHAYASDEEVTKYMLFGPNTKEETEKFLNLIINQYYQEEPMTHYEYAIEFEGQMIGGISIHLKQDEGEMGWILNPMFHQKGIMTEAAKALFDYAVNTFNIKRIIAKCDQRNQASMGVMKNLGMSFFEIEHHARVDKKSGTYQFDNVCYEVII